MAATALHTRTLSRRAWLSAVPADRVPEPVDIPDPADVAGVSDADLFERIQSGSTGAFTTFYDRHARRLFAVALRILGDVHEAEDALQEATVTLWEKAPVYDSRFGRPLSWAVTLTRNKAIDRLRSLRRKANLHQAAQDSGPGDLGESPCMVDDATAGEATGSIRNALAGLPPDQRKAIELAFYSGLSQTEISSALGIPLGTIKARIRRGMLSLRGVLEETL